MKEKIKLLTGVIIFIACLVYGVIITFTNPDMTEMRLLLTYWKEYILMFLLMIVGYLLIETSVK